MFWYSWYSGFSLFCHEFSLFCCGFSLFCREFSLFGRRFLYSAVAFFLLPSLSLFCRPFLYSAVSILYFAVVFFILSWVFFILTLLCLCCRDFNYVAVVLLFLPWQLWAAVQNKFILEKKVNIWTPSGYFPSFISFFCWNEINEKSSIKEDTRKMENCKTDHNLE